MKIQVEKLAYSYSQDKNYAISDISTVIENNEFVAIIGHTGSGKSTFIQNLNALITPSEGKITADEFVITPKMKIKNIKELRKKIGIVFQFPEYQLFEETIEKDILFGPKNFGLVKDNNSDIALKALEEVGLDKSFMEKSPFELSGGEKRRVAIAGILAFNPDVLILDEPTAGLDPNAAKSMMDLFEKLHQEGKTIILVTHNMDHVLEYANRVLVFHKGSLLADEKPSELFKNENLVKELEIDVPSVFELVNKVAIKYPKIKEYDIKNIKDFVTAYKEVISL